MLIGQAGTGKTTLLGMLCSLPGLAEKGLMLLAPTGKARVRLEEQTGMRGAGQTLAQFLIRQQRYDGETGAYFSKPRAPRCGDYRTVIVDECSMLTEEQLAALIDSLSNVERLVLVGDPRQLPPIGAGRPFVDIVRGLELENVETLFPRCGPRYQAVGSGRAQFSQSGPNSPETRVPVVVRRKRSGNVFATSRAQPRAVLSRGLVHPTNCRSAACGLRRTEGLDAPSQRERGRLDVRFCDKHPIAL